MRYVPFPVPENNDSISSFLMKELRRIQTVIQNTDSEFVWDDMKAPAAVLRVGSVSPSLNATYGWYEFSHNQDEYVFLQFQMPHDWALGTDLKPHVHWMKTTSAAGEVEWQLDYRWAKLGQVMDASWTTLSDMTPDVDDNDTQYSHALTGLGTISTGSTVGISDILVCKLTRLGTSYSGSSHYAATAAFYSFDIHYQRDIGSEQEFVKNV